jgi:hypothetical protein
MHTFLLCIKFKFYIISMLISSADLFVYISQALNKINTPHQIISIKAN